METINNIIDFLYNIIWSTPLVYLCLFSGLYFSLRTKFVQLRFLKPMIKLIFEGKESKRGISSFQALCTALAGRVGTGNIAGTATAIFYGGPGALFWMWLIAFLGAASAYIEAALGQVWKSEIDGEYRGGPAYYIEKGLGVRWYAMVFAVVTLLACGLLLPGLQSNAIAGAFQNAIQVPMWVSGIIIAFVISEALQKTSLRRHFIYSTDGKTAA